MTVAIKDVGYLARELSHQKSKYIFWLGAGVSVTAGIPAGVGIVDRLLDRSWLDAQEPSKGPQILEPYSSLSETTRLDRLKLVRGWALKNISGIRGLKRGKEAREPGAGKVDWGAHYSTCLALLPGEQVRQKFIVECIKEGKGKLNLAHLLMSQLMVNDFVRIVLTTNFDDLLLRALQLYFEIPSIIDADSTHTLMIDSMFLQVAYLHGRLTSYRQRHTERELHKSMPDLESFIVSSMKDHGLVVVGYRGGDEAPMKILTRALRRRGAGPGGGLFWVSYEKDFEKLSEDAQKILRMKDTYWLPGWDADRFFGQLCASAGIGLSLPDFLADPRKFAKRLGSILPEGARGPWNELQEPGPDVVATGDELSNPAGEDRVSPTSSERATSIPETRKPDGKGTFPPARDAVASPSLETPEQGMDRFRRATETDPKNSEVFFEWGNALASVGQYEEAIEKYRRATAINPKDAWSFYQWAETLKAQGRYEEATDKYRLAIEADPKHACAFSEWGDTLETQGRYEEAIDKYRLALEADPTHKWALTNWGDTLERQGRYEEAIDKYRLALKVDSKHAAALGRWGDILQRQGRDEEAIDKYRLALEADPKQAWTLRSWGDILRKQGRYEEAIDKYRLTTEAYPEAAATFVTWANVLRKLGRVEEAIEKYQRATEISPNYVSALVSLGYALQELGRDQEAIEKYRRATEIDPKMWAIFGRWGGALQLLDRHIEAIAVLQKATEINPKKAAIHVALAASYRKLDRQVDYLREVQEASELVSSESEYNRACFEAIRGNTNEALALLKVALEKRQQALAWVRRDPDFDSIREDPGFKLLVSLPDPQTGDVPGGPA